jgi:hypothetical protein
MENSSVNVTTSENANSEYPQVEKDDSTSSLFWEQESLAGLSNDSRRQSN